MVLEYKFKYLSNNNTLIKFSKAIVSEMNLAFEIFKEDDYIYLYINAKEEELLQISDKLSKELPMSIFLKDYSLEVLEQIPKREKEEFKDDFNLPYCLKCVKNVENKDSINYYDPFFKCNICGTPKDQTLVLLEECSSLNQKKEFKDNKELFEFLALKLYEEKRVKIKTKAGVFVFYKTTKLKSKYEKVLCTNINSISKLIVSSKIKMLALLSIEKPRIDFNLNPSYKLNNNLDFETVNISYSNDLILYLLSLELQKLNVDFLSYENSEIFDYKLSYDNTDDQLDFISTPYISMIDEKILLLENKNYDKKLDFVYNEIEQKSKAQFMVLIQENKLYDKSVLNIFSSSKYDDNISLYSNKIDGIIDILNYNIPSSLDVILDEITKEESGSKLIKNYKHKFPLDFERAYNYSIEKDGKNSMYNLWKYVAVVLGLEDINENIILENSRKAVLQKGPRVDYLLTQSDKIFNKDFRISKLIKSGISFKLAGVDDKTLSFGYLESYAYFLANIIDETNTQFPIQAVSLCGDLIGNKTFYDLINKAITGDFDLYYNKDFPIQL